MLGALGVTVGDKRLVDRGTGGGDSRDGLRRGAATLENGIVQLQLQIGVVSSGHPVAFGCAGISHPTVALLCRPSNTFHQANPKITTNSVSLVRFNTPCNKAP